MSKKVKLTGKLTVERGDKKVSYDKHLLEQRGRETMRKGLVGFDRSTAFYQIVQKAMNQKDLTRAEIITLYENLYGNVVEGLAGTEGAHREAREEAERAKSSYEWERKANDDLTAMNHKLRLQVEGLLSVIARAEQEEPHE